MFPVLSGWLAQSELAPLPVDEALSNPIPELPAQKKETRPPFSLVVANHTKPGFPGATADVLFFPGMLTGVQVRLSGALVSIGPVVGGQI